MEGNHKTQKTRNWMVEIVFPRPVQIGLERGFLTMDLSTEHKKRVTKIEEREGKEKGNGEKLQRKERRGKAED